MMLVFNYLGFTTRATNANNQIHIRRFGYSRLATL